MMRLKKTFFELKLNETRLRNAALIFVVVANREFLIYGDKGIDEQVDDDFWTSASDQMTIAFRDHSLCEGILTGIKAIGDQLALLFPAGTDNPDEISNKVEVDS